MGAQALGREAEAGRFREALAAATLYRLTGEFHGDKNAEVLVARVKVGKHNVVFMSQYPASESAKIKSAVLQIFVSTIVKIAE